MIVIKDLNKIYNEKKQNEFYALKDINLTVHDNELIILKGISGSGKSTLLSIIASFLKPTSGYIEIDGELTAKLPDYHLSLFRLHHIGFVFQSFNLFEQLSVYENMEAVLVPMKLNKLQTQEKIFKALKIANIFHKKDSTVSTLSGGEKQRTAIARALVNDADIILCDEPTANLDHQNSLYFLETVKKLKKLDKTIIIATHDNIFEQLDCKKRVIDIKNGILKQ
ncbi:MAG: ABC transporter ATP-binding protein [Campylobacterota bacterium]|nr:ABC transporter ATP-binding protein [Campylobacterota bacterium]